MSAGNGTAGLDLNALRALVLVVEAGGLSEASRRADIPKSTLSRQLRELELRIGSALFERRGRALAPTGAGLRLFDAARGSIAGLEALRHDLLGPPLSGHVRVAAPVTLARGPLREAIAAFLARHPAIRVTLALSDRFAAVQSRDADVAFAVGLATDARLPRAVLGTAEARLYAAPSLLAAMGHPRDVAALARLPMLAQGCAAGGTTSWTLKRDDGGEDRIAVVPRLVATDPDILLAAAVAGSGVVALPRFLAAQELAAGRLIPVLPDRVAERHEIAAVTLRRQRDPAVRRFVAATAEQLRRALAPAPA
jgi:DNA-binding transcriptional LysR family regulator